MFFVYRGLQGAPTGAGRRSQAVFRANLHEPKSKSHPKPSFLSGCATNLISKFPNSRLQVVLHISSPKVVLVVACVLLLAISVWLRCYSDPRV